MTTDGVFPELSDKPFQAPHCNAEVLHAPGTCVYCDHYPDRQRMREAANTPFTPAEANGWSGNTAAPRGEVHTHMGASFVPDDAPAPYVPPRRRRALDKLLDRFAR